MCWNFLVVDYYRIKRNVPSSAFFLEHFQSSRLSSAGKSFYLVKEYFLRSSQISQKQSAQPANVSGAYKSDSGIEWDGIWTHDHLIPMRRYNQLRYQAMNSTHTESYHCAATLISRFVQLSCFISVIACVSHHIYF